MAYDTFLTKCECKAAEDTKKGSGDFTDCKDRIVPAMQEEGKGPDDPDAFCAWYEHEQTGSWPGEKSKNAEFRKVALAAWVASAEYIKERGGK